MARRLKCEQLQRYDWPAGDVRELQNLIDFGEPLWRVQSAIDCSTNVLIVSR